MVKWLPPPATSARAGSQRQLSAVLVSLMACNLGSFLVEEEPPGRPCARVRSFPPRGLCRVRAISGQRAEPYVEPGELARRPLAALKVLRRSQRPAESLSQRLAVSRDGVGVASLKVLSTAMSISRPSIADLDDEELLEQIALLEAQINPLKLQLTRLKRVRAARIARAARTRGDAARIKVEEVRARQLREEVGAIRGSIPLVSDQLGVSERTVRRRLKATRK